MLVLFLMNNEYQNQNYSINNQPSYSNNLTPVVNTPSSQSNSSAIKKVRKISAWILIFSAILFTLIAIMSIWGVFHHNINIAWRSAASLAVISLAAFIVNIGARIYEGKSR